MKVISANEVRRKAKAFDMNWDLVNNIRALCDEALDDKTIYAEDVHAALERVKWYFLANHVEGRIETRLEKAGIKLPEHGD